MAVDNQRQLILSQQLRLSELLYIRYEDLEVDGSDFADKDTKREIAVLDIVATALTSGHPGDATAAALDKKKGVVLVIAKNRTPTSTDGDVVHQFLDLIAKPEVQKIEQVFPFLLSHCLTNMHKCIYKFHDSLQELNGLLESHPSGVALPPLRMYKPASIGEEFPKTEKYRSKKFTREPSFEVMLTDIIASGLDFCSQAFNLDPRKPADSLTAYSMVCLPAKQLSDCRFLRVVCDESRSGNLLYLKPCVTRLMRRIDKVRRFRDGIESMLRNVKRTFPGGNIPWRWAAPELDATGEGQHGLVPDYRQALNFALQNTPQSQKSQAIAKIAQQFPALATKWGEVKVLSTHIHAEIRLILDLDGVAVTGGSRKVQKAIGCGKCTCACCYLWIDAYNVLFGTTWITSRATGKPRSDWAFPGALVRSPQNNFPEVKVSEGINALLERILNYRLYGDQSDSTEEMDPSMYAAIKNSLKISS